MIKHICQVLAEFSSEQQEAFDTAWSEGDTERMEKLIEEHQRKSGSGESRITWISPGHSQVRVPLAKYNRERLAKAVRRQNT